MSHCQHPHHHHPEHSSRVCGDPDALVGQLLERLRGEGMRRTRLLRGVLAALAGSGRPQTITGLGQMLEVGCDPATLYRMIERLVDAAVVRRLGLQGRALYYELLVPGRHRDYLICTGCGAIGDIDADCPVDAMEAQLAARTGYSGLLHELVFYGICPECQREQTGS